MSSSDSSNARRCLRSMSRRSYGVANSTSDLEVLWRAGGDDLSFSVASGSPTGWQFPEFSSSPDGKAGLARITPLNGNGAALGASSDVPFAQMTADDELPARTRIRFVKDRPENRPMSRAFVAKFETIERLEPCSGQLLEESFGATERFEVTG